MHCLLTMRRRHYIALTHIILKISTALLAYQGNGIGNGYRGLLLGAHGRKNMLCTTPRLTDAETQSGLAMPVSADPLITNGPLPSHYQLRLAA